MIRPVAEPPRLWAVTTDSPVSPARLRGRLSDSAVPSADHVVGAGRRRRSATSSPKSGDVRAVGGQRRPSSHSGYYSARMHPTLDNEPGVGAGRLRKSQEATRRLLDAAVEVFGERGFEAARSLRSPDGAA